MIMYEYSVCLQNTRSEYLLFVVFGVQFGAFLSVFTLAICFFTLHAFYTAIITTYSMAGVFTFAWNCENNIGAFNTPKNLLTLKDVSWLVDSERRRSAVLRSDHHFEESRRRSEAFSIL